MSQITFLNQPSIGHLNTLLSIANQMKAEGHSTRFLVPGGRGVKTGIQILDTGFAIHQKIEQSGHAFSALSPAWSPLWKALFLPFKSGYAEIEHALDIFSSGLEHYTRHVLKQIERERPDILVTDFGFPASSLAADIAQIPFVTVYHSGLPFRGEGIPAFGSGLPIGESNGAEAKTYETREARLLERIDSRINKARRAFGLSPIDAEFLRRPYSPWLNLVTSATVMEAPRQDLGEHTFFVGPCIGKRSESSDVSFDFLRKDAYKIYVSLGTVFNRKPEVFRKILRSLDQEAYQVIVSAGGAYPALSKGPIPSNAKIFPSVPQIRLLSEIDLFISHGGNNSTNESLAAGKPLIVLPVGGEQADNGSRVVYLGVGKKLDIQRFDEAQLRHAVEEIRTTPRYQERAFQVMEGLRETDGVAAASRCIAWVAAHQKPLQRREDIPLTITPADLDRWLDSSSHSAAI